MTEEVGHKFKDSRVVSPGLADSTLPVGRERMGASLLFFFSGGGGVVLYQQSVNKEVIPPGFGKYITDLPKKRLCSRAGSSKG